MVFGTPKGSQTSSGGMQFADKIRNAVRDEQGTGFTWVNPISDVKIFGHLMPGGHARHVDERYARCICGLPGSHAHEFTHLRCGQSKFFEVWTPGSIPSGTVKKRRGAIAPGKLAHRCNGARVRSRICCGEMAHVLHYDQIKDAR